MRVLAGVSSALFALAAPGPASAFFFESDALAIAERFCFGPPVEQQLAVSVVKTTWPQLQYNEEYGADRKVWSGMMIGLQVDIQSPQDHDFISFISIQFYGDVAKVETELSTAGDFQVGRWEWNDQAEGDLRFLDVLHRPTGSRLTVTSGSSTPPDGSEGRYVRLDCERPPLMTS